MLEPVQTTRNMSDNQFEGSSVVAIFLAFLATLFFVVLSFQWAFVLTTPSDPLQYVEPALRPELGFPFMDRIVVWLWIRLVALLPMPIEMIGGVSTLIVTATTLFVATWWLAKRVQPLAGATFGALYIASPMVLGLSTYTYPIQPMTLIILLTLVIMDFYSGGRRSLVGGVGGGIACLCKIQGVSFLGFLALDALTQRHRRFSRLFVAIGGFIIAVLIIFMIVGFIDGPTQIVRLFRLYFLRGDGDSQYRGLGLGNMPPFYEYLAEPTTIAAFAGMIWPWLNPNLSRLRPFATAAAVQTVGLITIYAITRRGGSLIYNYTYDTLVLGLVAFAGAVVWTVKDNKPATNCRLLMSSLLLAVTFLIVEVLAYRLTSFCQYSPINVAATLGGKILAGVAWGGILICLTAQRLKLTGYWLRLTMILGAGLLALGVGLRAGEGVRDGIFKGKESASYHALGRQIAAIRLQSVGVKVSVALNRSLDDCGFRIKTIYDAFYSKQISPLQQEDAIVFGGNDTALLRFLMTDQAYLIHKHSGLPRKALPSFNSQPIQVTASKINNNPSLPFRLGGLLGDALITQQGAGLVIEPVATSRKLEIQLELMPNDTLAQRLQSLVVLSVEGVNPPSDVSVQLFAQFQLNGSWSRISSTLIQGHESVGIMHVIPSHADNISFGWYIEADKFNEPIRLPPVLFSSIDWLENGHPIAVIDRSNGSIVFSVAGD